MLIIAATYERILYGLEFNSEFKLEFSFPAHISSISSLGSNLSSDAKDSNETRRPPKDETLRNDADSANANDGMQEADDSEFHESKSKTKQPKKAILATGGTDEHIKLYDLATRVQIGTLSNHSGTITSIKFINNQHLITAADDGEIGVYRTSDWELLKMLKEHTMGITSMAVHPSNKILLSTSKDLSTRLWDLTRGIQVGMFRTRRIITYCEWSPCGKYYLLLQDYEIVIVCVGDETRLKLKSKSRITCAKFHNNEICYGGDDKMVRFVDYELKPTREFNTMHDLRVKDFGIFNQDLVTCSSDGSIKVWDLEKLQLKGEYKTGCRITCIMVLPSVEQREKKQKPVPLPVQIPESDYDEITLTEKVVVTVDSEGQNELKPETSRKRKFKSKKYKKHKKDKLAE